MTGNTGESTLAASTQKESNTLFPVFFKLEKLTTLVVGGGYVATEKLTAVFNNSPEAKVKLVATEISPSVKEIIDSRGISFVERPFEASDLDGIDLAIIAIDDKEVSRSIHADCARKRVLTNVADKPELCDFYLSSIVQKGNLKIAISTNGKSPTVAKRVKEVLNEVIPEEMNQLLNNMEGIRKTLGGDFSDKVRQLNEITSVLTDNSKSNTSRSHKPAKYFVYIVIAIALMIAGHLLFELAGF
jgi:siroheme synthase-like protein